MANRMVVLPEEVYQNLVQPNVLRDSLESRLIEINNELANHLNSYGIPYDQQYIYVDQDMKRLLSLLRKRREHGSDTRLVEAAISNSVNKALGLGRDDVDSKRDTGPEKSSRNRSPPPPAIPHRRPLQGYKHALPNIKEEDNVENFEQDPGPRIPPAKPSTNSKSDTANGRTLKTPSVEKMGMNSTRQVFKRESSENVSQTVRRKKSKQNTEPLKKRRVQPRARVKHESKKSWIEQQPVYTNVKPEINGEDVKATPLLKQEFAAAAKPSPFDKLFDYNGLPDYEDVESEFQKDEEPFDYPYQGTTSKRIKRTRREYGRDHGRVNLPYVSVGAPDYIPARHRYTLYQNASTKQKGEGRNTRPGTLKRPLKPKKNISFKPTLWTIRH